MEQLLHNTHPALRRCWHPVARCADIGDRPVRAMLCGEPWVLWRAPEGVVAYVDRCPHRLAPLSLGVCDGDGIRCVYHGWRFDAAGRCIEIPALGPDSPIARRASLLRAHGVVERDGMVFLAPEAPLSPVGSVAEAQDPAFMAGDLPVVVARASAGLLADNFLDMAHFPFVHPATFGAEDRLVPDYSLARDGWTFEVVTEHTFVNREDPGVAEGIRPPVQRRRVTYRVTAPFHLVLRIDFLDSGGSNVIGFFLQPETDESCRIYSTIWRDDLGGDPERMAEAVAFELAVVREDLDVQERYDRLALPLDPRAELHTRADRSTLELRRMLAELVTVSGHG